MQIRIVTGLLFLLLPFFNTQAQQVKELNINGLKVIYLKIPKDVISVRLFVDGGTANYGKDQEGIEALAFSLAMGGGTSSKDKVTFNSQAEKIGAAFGGESTYDYGNLNMTCIKPFWNESWELFTEAVLKPAFNEKEFELMREQMLNNALQTASDPDEYIRSLSMKTAFGEGNYTKIPEGSPESLKNITLQQVFNHYKAVLGKERCFLVVVGNVSEEDLTIKVKNSLASLPAGSAPKSEGRILFTEGTYKVEHRDIPTNYIRGLMSSPQMTQPDGIPMRMAMSILGDRFFVELRTKRSLSYAPAAFYSTGVQRNPYSVLYISTQKPKEAMDVMVSEINKIKKEGFLEKELKDQKQQFLTQYYMALETSSSQSLLLGSYEIAGAWEQYYEVKKRTDEVTLGELNRVFNKYSTAIRWTYLGKQEQVAPEDFKQTLHDKNAPY